MMDEITLRIHVPLPWYVRLWRRITRNKDPIYTVTKVVNFTVGEVRPGDVVDRFGVRRKIQK